MAGRNRRRPGSSDTLFESLDDLIRESPTEGDIYRVSMSMGKKLNEKKVHLLENVVRIAGMDLAQKVLRLTLEREKNGGCVTVRGTRRTPGGAYLTLLKEHVSATQYKEIYKDDRRWKSKLRQVRRREQVRTIQRVQDKLHCTTHEKKDEDDDPTQNNDSKRKQERGANEGQPLTLCSSSSSSSPPPLSSSSSSFTDRRGHNPRFQSAMQDSDDE